MKSILYSSTATPSMTTDVLRDILATSRRNNTRNGVTGVLLYRSGHFLQLIEGDDAAQEALMAAIEVDERHVNVTTLLVYEIDERRFPSWTMGFSAVDDPEAKLLPGYRKSLQDIFLAPAGTYAEFLPSLRVLTRWYTAHAA